MRIITRSCNLKTYACTHTLAYTHMRALSLSHAYSLTHSLTHSKAHVPVPLFDAGVDANGSVEAGAGAGAANGSVDAVFCFKLQIRSHMRSCALTHVHLHTPHTLKAYT